MTTRSTEYRTIAYLLGALAVIVFAVQAVDFMNFTVDDVFIPMRVAVNVVAGKGPVYNVGELVEGFSDPLWVAALVGGLRSGIVSATEPMALLWFARALSLLFGIGSILGARVLIRTLLPDSTSISFERSLVTLLIAACAPFVLWSSGALEMTVVSFCYVVAAIAASKLVLARTERGLASMLTLFASLAIASLTRPEPPLIAGLLFVFVFLHRTDRLRLVLTVALPYALVLAVLEWWRWSTYHALLPNTFYAKTGGGIAGIGMGFKYFFGALGATVGAYMLALPFAFRKNAAPKAARAAVTVIVLAQLFFTIYSTGDWMPGARFMIPIVPLMLVLAVVGIRSVLVRFELLPMLSARPMASFAIVLVIVLAAMFGGRTTIRGEVPGIRSGIEVHTGYGLEHHEDVGKWLQVHGHSGESFCTGEAGLIGYMNMGMRLVDLNGLMDAKIAMDRKTGAALDCGYVVRRAPDYVLIDVSPDAVFYDNIYMQLRRYPEFVSNYFLVDRIGYTEIYIRRDHQYVKTPQQ